MATTTKKPAKPRKPEEVWYDVHKHPAGVPGGMGRSPEHHLRNRGWSGHEINESAGRKTIQYRNHQYPDFVISYGGGTSQKPDHNFRVLYMGTNHNVPKVHHTYSVADAMNKVEELHKLQTGLVVQPLTAVQAATTTAPAAKTTVPSPSNPVKRKDMNDDPNDPPIGPPKVDFPTQPDRAVDWPKKQKPQVQEIKPPPKPKPTPAPKPAPITTTKQQQTLKYAAHGTLTGRNRHKKASEDLCPLCRKASAIYSRDPDLYRTLVQDSGGLTGEHLRVTSEFHDRVQKALIPRGEYQRQRRQARDADVARAAGMDIQPWEVADYRGLRAAIAALQSTPETWEEA